MKFFQLILLPLAWLYEGILRLRNHLYDIGFTGSSSFDLPIINVGNLAFGGTGKTPHIEYLIRLFSKENYRLAVLSRGYKRKTIGYVFATEDSTPFTLGDEPFQIASKFKNIAVAVSENRVLGVPNLLFDAPETDIILLDDAYQHRALKPGLNILLTEQNRLYCEDYLVPCGYLREYKGAAKRADIIVVTKCQQNLSENERANIIRKLNPLPHQQVFFSHIVYGSIVPFFNDSNPTSFDAILGISGIARPVIFEQHLRTLAPLVQMKSYPDHHEFTDKDLDNIIAEFDQLNSSRKVIISTEKDYQKLVQANGAERIRTLPIFYLPIEIAFSELDEKAFQKTILQYVSSHPREY
ncbi:MAG: tetraacyldisaccharide 4'-kinase [Bacteroidia bacterium]|nr:tetraacyldisaccharide 4'-kinase [Bacteroidia bacterium]